MSIIRVGAVSYLNARPLAEALERQHDRFAVRYDLPSTCARLLHAHEIDLGLIPSIEYLHGDTYHIVPGCAVASDGPVASVALFTPRPIREIRSIALDTSSRTSVALTRVLCAQSFDIAPRFVDHPPDLPAMLARADAALLIGDRALFADWQASGLQKIDLGEAWRALTGLPFVYAFWAGHPGALTDDALQTLQEARAEGEAHVEAIAERFFPGDPERVRVGARYLRENIHFRLDAPEAAGLERFFALAVDVGAAPAQQPLRWYGTGGP